MTSRPLPEASRATIVDVAARAGVSKSLVSLVMRSAGSVSEKRRNLVLQAADELGYRPNTAARALVQQRTQLLGVMVSDLHNQFFTEVIDGVHSEAARQGFRVIVTTGHRQAADEAVALETLLDLRTDGLILASPALATSMIVAAAREIPTVLVARRIGSRSVDSVVTDDRLGVALAVRHLVSLGHQHIVHLDGGDGAGAADRSEGYVSAMRDAGLAEFTRVVPGRYTESGGHAAAKALLAAREGCTAILAANDLAAVGALSALAELGLRVPEDISLVGYDNTALAAVRHINLTTVDQPRPAMGHSAVSLLLERISGERTVAQHRVVAPSLVIRGTTAPPRERL